MLGQLVTIRQNDTAVIKISDQRILGFAAIATTILSPFYYGIGYAAGSSRSFSHTFLWTTGTVAVILAGYQLLFFVQTCTVYHKAHVVSVQLDKKIPFIVGWVWVYGVLYYAFLGLPLAFIEHSVQYQLFLLGGMGLVILTIPVYIFWPSACPPEWRLYHTTNWSFKFLSFIQEMDNGRTCIPSLHCALSAYSATFLPNLTLTIVIPVLVSISCVFVKQHSIVDQPGSLMLGFTFGFAINSYS